MGKLPRWIQEYITPGNVNLSIEEAVIIARKYGFKYFILTCRNCYDGILVRNFINCYFENVLKHHWKSSLFDAFRSEQIIICL